MRRASSFANSILRVDFINLKRAEGMLLKEAMVRSVSTRAPILLTAVAAMLGALFIPDAPIFNEPGRYVVDLGASEPPLPACIRRQVAGGIPNSRRNARLRAASVS